MAERIHYRKLPGHRRGFVHGSSVWVGPDHLLAVNSLRFREEYKRYYFRDIQAITIAKRPRFHLSTRAAVIGYLWLMAFGVLFRFPHGAAIVGAAGIALVATWVYFSALCSCTCRIHTAVSQDRLPSIYRTWIAQRFLQAVEPQISAIQGALEQPPSDLEAVQIGPRRPIAERVPSPTPPTTVPHRSFSFSLLLAILMMNALLSWLALQHVLRESPLISNILALLEIAAAILVLVHRHHRRVSPAQQKLAIATLIGVGLFFYGTIVSTAVVAGAGAATRQPVDTAAIARVSTQLDFMAALILSVAGLAILIFEKRAPQEQGSIIS